ncbi:MAG: Vacuolar-sorting protein SNF7, partial [Chaenotheca gracillima]
MKSMLAPIIKEDMLAYERAADKKEHLKVTENGKVPFTGWLMSRYKAGQATAKQIAIDYLITGFESTPSSAATLYNIVADLAVRPETVEMLREEIATVMKDGKLPLTHLQELKKMDSVMRESIRMNPFSLFSLYRVAKKPFRVSNGPEIPAGAMICVDSHHINSDPKHWEKPDV